MQGRPHGVTGRLHPPLRGRDRDEDRVESFEVRRAGSHGVRVRPGAGYVKLRIRAEDDDRRGRYAVAIHRR